MIKNLFDKSVLIFGCGNILWGDDGFGPAVINHLQENYDLPEDVLTMDMGTSIRDILFNLSLSEKKPQKIIIVDAVTHKDRKPGEVFEIPVKGIPDNKKSDFSLHQFPTVNMLEELQEQTAVEVRIVVAQTGNVPDEVKPGLSKDMEMAVVKACDHIMPLLSNVA